MGNKYLNKFKEYDKRHGGPYDRGGADAYYQRPFSPHYFMGDTNKSERVEILDDGEEFDAYRKGFKEQVASGEFKDWGN